MKGISYPTIFLKILRKIGDLHTKKLSCKKLIIYILTGSSSNDTDTKDLGEKTSSQFTGILSSDMCTSSGSLPPISSMLHPAQKLYLCFLMCDATVCAK